MKLLLVLFATLLSAALLSGCGFGRVEFDSELEIDPALYRVENLRCEHHLITQRLDDDSVVDADSFWARGEVINLSDETSPFWSVDLYAEFSDGAIVDNDATTSVPPMLPGDRKEFSTLIRVAGPVDTHGITQDDILTCEVELFDSIFNW